MKALIVYFTTLGKTKKTAEAIGQSLTNFQVDYFGFELTGIFGQKVGIIGQLEKGDFSSMSEDLLRLDQMNQDYDLYVIGMPTYGNKPPGVYKEIVKRVEIEGKPVAYFGTCAGNGWVTMDQVTAAIEEFGGNLVDKIRLRGFFKPKLKEAAKFGKSINDTLAVSN
jgi:flavodoxin